MGQPPGAPRASPMTTQPQAVAPAGDSQSDIRRFRAAFDVAGEGLSLLDRFLALLATPGVTGRPLA
jgi:hypothetical protein